MTALVRFILRLLGGACRIDKATFLDSSSPQNPSHRDEILLTQEKQPQQLLDLQQVEASSHHAQHSIREHEQLSPQQPEHKKGGPTVHPNGLAESISENISAASETIVGNTGVVQLQTHQVLNQVDRQHDQWNDHPSVTTASQASGLSYPPVVSMKLEIMRRSLDQKFKSFEEVLAVVENFGTKLQQRHHQDEAFLPGDTNMNHPLSNLQHYLSFQEALVVLQAEGASLKEFLRQLPIPQADVRTILKSQQPGPQDEQHPSDYFSPLWEGLESMERRSMEFVTPLWSTVNDSVVDVVEMPPNDSDPVCTTERPAVNDGNGATAHVAGERYPTVVPTGFSFHQAAWSSDAYVGNEMEYPVSSGTENDKATRKLDSKARGETLLSSTYPLRERQVNSKAINPRVDDLKDYHDTKSKKQHPPISTEQPFSVEPENAVALTQLTCDNRRRKSPTEQGFSHYLSSKRMKTDDAVSRRPLLSTSTTVASPFQDQNHQ